MRDLTELPLLAILATQRADDTTLLSPVWHKWSDGGFSIYIVAGDAKSKGIARNSTVSIVVDEQTRPFYSIEVRADAVVGKSEDRYEAVERIAVR